MGATVAQRSGTAARTFTVPAASGDSTGATDTARLQSAINAAAAAGGGTVKLQPNTDAIPNYWVNTSITLPDDVTLEGPGVIKAINDPSGTPGFLVLVNADTTNGNSNVTVRNLTVDGNKANRNAAGTLNTGIRFLASDDNRCRNMRIEGVEVRNIPIAAIQVMNTEVVAIVDNVIDNTGRDAITVWFNSSYVTIAGNRVTDSRDDCIAINCEASPHIGTRVRYVTIDGNVVAQAADSTFGTGINVAGATDVAVTGNVIEYAQGWGIVAQGGLVSGASMLAERVSIVGNTIKSSGSAASGNGGIALSTNSRACVVADNIVEGYYSNGIQVGSAAPVTGNFIGTGTSTTGIGVLVSASYATVTGNYLRQTASTGISITAEKVTAAANTLEECCQQQAGGAYILISNVARNNVTGNVIRRSTTGTYGVRISSGTATGNVVANNVAQGFAAGNGFSDGSTGNNSFVTNDDGLSLVTPRVVAQTVAQQQVANSSAETSLFSWTIPASVTQAGTTYRMVCTGTTDNVATSGTLTVRVRIGGIGGNSVGALVLASQASARTGQAFTISTDLVFRTSGSGGTCFGTTSGVVMFQNSTPAQAATSGQRSVNTTTTQELVFTAQWATADAGNVFNLETATLQLVKP